MFIFINNLNGAAKKSLPKILSLVVLAGGRMCKKKMLLLIFIFVFWITQVRPLENEHFIISLPTWRTLTEVELKLMLGILDKKTTRTTN
jgi:hypothetical protein